jgi:membrane fusion protein (multidrug efflux system)
MSRLTLFTMIALSATLALLGCGEGSKLEKTAHAQDASATATNVAAEKEIVPANVKTTLVTPTTLDEELFTVGDTTADKDVRFSAESAGRVEYLSVDVGDKVRKGQILARIDYQMQKAQAEQAEASFELAKKTYERLSALKAEELVSQQQIDEAHANMISAQAGVAIAQVNLDKSVIHSTTDGIVVEKHVEIGEYVGPGTPLMRIVDTDPIYVISQVPESQIATIEPGMTAQVRIDALNETVAGVVDYVLPTSVAISKTFAIRIRLDGNNPHILAGMAATVRIQTAVHQKALVIPQESIVEESDSRYLFVVKDGQAYQRAARLGPVSGDNVMVLEGLSAGEELVVIGQRSLVDGQPVRVID